MKKLISLLTALMLALGCTAAFAEAAPIEPVHALDMDIWSYRNSTVYVDFVPSDIDIVNRLSYKIYDIDLYSTEAIRSLKAGDEILVNGSLLTVNTVEEVNGGIDVNGGFFTEEGEGASFAWVDGDPDHMISVTYNDAPAMSWVLWTESFFAEEVLVSVFEMSEDLDYTGNQTEVTVPGDEIRFYLKNLTEPGDPELPLSFTHPNTTLTLKDGCIVEVKVTWSPA